MPRFLGIDTSNYTTSVALYDTSDNSIVMEKKLLPVKKGELGLRQSDAVFHHTMQLPQIIHELSEKCDLKDIDGIGVSDRPRNADGSYMPCFMCGNGLAESFSTVMHIPVYHTSHQIGHILAALYSADKLELVRGKFAAFHISGGTTDCLLCTPDSDKILDIAMMASSLDLKGGQLIDRTGVMLGLDFPCGKELEKLASRCTSDVRKFGLRPVLKNGNCCMSGFQNKLENMHSNGCQPEDIARACEYAVAVTVGAMTDYLESANGSLPIIYAGGVMSNRYIASFLSNGREAYFAQPEYSCDNAAGTAIFAAIISGCADPGMMRRSK